MANAQRNTEDQELPRGAVTKALLNWQTGGGSTPFSASGGPEAASDLLLKANALAVCLATAQASADEDDKCEYALLGGSYKQLGLEAIGDLILLAKLLVDEV